MGRTKLTDKKKQKIVADYIENENYSETARMNKVSDSTVRRIVKSAEEDVLEKVEQKKEQNTQEMLEYLDSKKQDAFNLVDMLITGMMDEDKIAKAPIHQLGTAMGIVIDKFTKGDTGKAKGEYEDLSAAVEMLNENG